MTEFYRQENLRPVKPERRRGEAPSGFLRNDEGSLIIFSLFIFVIMLVVAGIGVDFMRYEAQRTRLQATLDRAILAAASLDQPLDPEDVVLDYFDKAGLGDYISADDITVTESASSREVDASANMSINSTLLRFVGIDTLNAPAAGAAAEAISETEISLILDVSGSMGWDSSSGDTKISLLQEAATAFVNIVMCDPSDSTATTNCTVDPDLVTINLIPYNEQVVVGETLLTAFNGTTEHTSSSCVTFEDSDFDTAAIDLDVGVQRTGHFDYNSRSSRSASDWVCETDSWREIAPVEGDASVLRTQISNLSAGGYTSIDLGMKWGTALLNEAAQTVVDTLIDSGDISATYADRPASSGSQKVIVLMTDGENTYQHYLYDGFRSGLAPIWRTEEIVSGSDYYYSVYYADYDLYYWTSDSDWHDHAYGTGSHDEQTCTRSGGRGGSYTCTTTTVDETAYGATQMDYVELWSLKPWKWYDQFSWLPTQGSYYDYDDKNTHLDAICTAAKEEGVTVYTVGFEVSDSSGAIMQSCATGDAYYFDVDGSDLVTAFAAIARDISELRLIN